tara:strand:- start:45 stop:356 length:312 start_codon:yes stop_codon:yes gene_type:complete
MDTQGVNRMSTLEFHISTDLLRDLARLLERRIQAIDKWFADNDIDYPVFKVDRLPFPTEMAATFKDYETALKALNEIGYELKYREAREDETPWSVSSYENPYD